MRGQDGLLDLLKLLVGEAAAKEDGLGRLALLGGDARVGSEARGGRRVQFAGEDGGQFDQGDVGVGADVDDLRGVC